MLKIAKVIPIFKKGHKYLIQLSDDFFLMNIIIPEQGGDDGYLLRDMNVNDLTVTYVDKFISF